MERDSQLGPHDVQAARVSLDPLFVGQIDYLIRMIRIREIRAIEQMLSPMGLTLSSWYPLAVLRDSDGVSQRELGVRLSLKDAAIGKAVDVMERAGLVARVVGKDRRKSLVYLTEPGKGIAEQVANKRQELLDVLLDDFSDDEVAQFSSYLERSYSNIVRFVDAHDA